jgi:hypothetical protein
MLKEKQFCFWNYLRDITNLAYWYNKFKVGSPECYINRLHHISIQNRMLHKMSQNLKDESCRCTSISKTHEKLLYHMVRVSCFWFTAGAGLFAALPLSEDRLLWPSFPPSVGYGGAFNPGVKTVERRDIRLPPFSAEVKNAYIFISTPSLCLRDTMHSCSVFGRSRVQISARRSAILWSSRDCPQSLQENANILS